MTLTLVECWSHRKKRNGRKYWLNRTASSLSEMKHRPQAKLETDPVASRLLGVWMLHRHKSHLMQWGETQRVKPCRQMLSCLLQRINLKPSWSAQHMCTV